MAAVTKNPLGSLPGVNIFASSPTTKPMRIVQMMCMLYFSFEDT
jgi:hypothetical protein